MGYKLICDDKDLDMGIEKGSLNEIWQVYIIDDLSNPFFHALK